LHFYAGGDIVSPNAMSDVLKFTPKKQDRAALEVEFQETEWDGCTHLDCIPGCSHNLENWRCERFEQAFEKWVATRTGDPRP
jgi:hypothetical protein